MPANKTPFFARWLGGNLVVASQLETTGRYVFVSSDDGTDATGYGASPDAPVATIDYAVQLCTANENDIIVVMPGHTETVVAAGGITFDIAGVRVVGLGQGIDRPTITFTTAATADVLVSAACVTLENLVFVNGIADQAEMVDVDATDCTIRNCEFRQGAATTQLDMLGINGGGANACDRAHVVNCVFKAPAAGNSDAAIELSEIADGVVIEGCTIYGDFDEAAIHNPTGKILTNLTLKGNVVSNILTGIHAIELVSACTGVAVGNMLYGDTLGTILDPGALWCNGNKETDAVDQAGVDSPRASAGGFPDDSITAASIDTGAFTADAYAADALVAATFATGAFTADAFAADALVAATFATGAFTADAFAANALVAATFAADCLAAASFATGCLTADAFAADALIAATFNTGCLTADAFAADALVAATFATGALTADAFAADAIVAATLATGALTADAFAANALVTATFAADFLTNALLADNVISEEQIDADAAQKTTMGIKVARGAADVINGATVPLYTVAGGMVAVHGLVGIVSAFALDGGASATKYSANPTTGTANDLCATADINAAEIGQMLSLTGEPATAMQVGSGGVPLCTAPICVNIGTIDIISAADIGTGGGLVGFTIYYTPIDTGATITAI